MSEYVPPRVPDELNRFMDEGFLELHKRWQNMDKSELLRDAPEPTNFGGAVILNPRGDRDDTTVVMLAPHQQTYKPSMYLRARFLQESVMPNSRLVFVPNNGRSSENYSLSPESRELIANGDVSPFYRGVVSILEAAGVRGDVYATGYSKGGLDALGVAGQSSDKFDIKLINADEAPNKPRTPKELQKDFLASGGWSDQRRAIADAEIPALSQVLSASHLGADYVRFGLATLSGDNKALHAGMAKQPFEELLFEATNGRSDRVIKLGYVAGSLLVDKSLLWQQVVSVHDITQAKIGMQEYHGEATRKHTTGDNIAASALMFKQAVSLLLRKA